MAKLTVFTSENPLTKTYWADGRKESPSFSRGSFEVRDVDGHDELKDLIKELTHYQALCYSTPLELTSGTIVTKGNENEEAGVISRTKEYFNYPNGEGWLFIDHDDDWSEEEVIDRLGHLHEPFGTASYVYATSSSHGIDGKRGFHLYFKVEGISNVNQAMGNLFKKAFNAGYGLCKVSEAGSILTRTFFDNAVHDRARLDFIAGPICKGRPTPPRDIRVVRKGNASVNLVPLLPPVDASEAIQAERDKVSDESERKTVKAAKERGMAVSEYRALRDGGVLHPGITLLREDGTEFDVAQILKLSMEAYLKDIEMGDIPIQHPVEQGLEEKTILYFNASSGVPAINTFAHGGQTWILKDDGSVIDELSKEYPNLPFLIENLRVAHGLKGQQGEADILPLHPDTYAVLHLMLKTFIVEYKSERLLIEQWGEMISLFLHLIDGHKGRYSIELPPSHGKTQVICHVILWLYQSKRIVPISLSMFRIEDIDKNKQWLLERMGRQWESWGLSGQMGYPFPPSNYLKVKHCSERTSFEELDNAPVIIHTHHVVRRNDFKERFFTYGGKERHLFIFDEAMFRSLLISENTLISIDHLNYAITRIDTGIVHDLPKAWLENFKSKLEKAFGMLEQTETIANITIDMPLLPERYVTSGYSLDNADSQNFILKLMNIGATEDAKFIVHRAQGAKGRDGGKVLFASKENDIHLLPRVINTDATRSTRMVHQYGSNCLKYPIDHYSEDEGVVYWIAPFKKTGKEEVGKDMSLHLLVAQEWLTKIRPQKVLVITSKGMPLEGKINGTPIATIHPNIKHIHWGQHKQTNDYKDCDAVIVMNYFRKRGYNYLHDIYGESGEVVTLSSGLVREVERGFIIDELIQGFCRGTMREGKHQNCLMFSPHSAQESDLLDAHLSRNIGPKDQVKLFEYNLSLSAIDHHYKTEEERKAKERKTRSDKKYDSPQEKERAKSLRRACKKDNIQCTKELLESYLQDNRDEPDGVSASKWLKANPQTVVI